MSPLKQVWIFVALFGYCATEQPDVEYMSATLDPATKALRLVPGKQSGAVAWGSFQDTMNRDGWSYLELRTNPTYDDEVAAYAAGALEGVLSRGMMKNHLTNIFGGYCKNNADYCKRVEKYFTDQLVWLNERAQEERSRSPYWNQVYLILRQLAGLEDGYYNRTLNPNATYEVATVIFYLNNEGAFYDLETAFKRTPDSRSFNSVTPCSLLVKVTENDLLLGHTTWTSYRGMLRLQKKYTLRFQQTQGSGDRVPGHTISMSSYPGKLDSVDDFYVMSTGLAVSETTNMVYNKTLYKYLTPQSVPTDFRVMVANRLAQNGNHWVRTFEKHNSGLYNNQWIVIDYNKISNPSTGIKFSNGTFWMVEQIPSLMVARDMTDVLQEQGYWSSFNVAYFSEIYDKSGYRSKFLKHGDIYSHDNCPRAKIFRRDQAKVVDPASMLTMLRYNDYKSDPLSRCNCTPPYSPVYAIASRYDLLEEDGQYDDPDLKMLAQGAIDVKVADRQSIVDFSFTAISGPTNDIQPTFAWSKSKFNAKPLGHPDVFNFKPVRHRWEL